MDSLLRDLPDYLAWANGLALPAVRDNETAELVRIMAHILGCERVWANRILGQPADAVPWPDWDLTVCEQRIPQNAALYQTIVDTVDTGRDVRFTTMRGEAFTNDAGTLVLHVFAHGAYHRGQIAQNIRRVGGDVADSDYFVFKMNR